MRPFRKLREGRPMTPAQVAVILLNENVVIHTPVLIKPIVGRELVSFAVSISSQSRDDPGRYIFEGKIDARTTFLRWQGIVEGHKIESLELLTDDENGLLLERTVAYRPFPTLKIFRDRGDRSERRQGARRHVGLSEGNRNVILSVALVIGRLSV